ncbi:hypothetical protein Aperf_G00000105848 [Anoplocephala perfoliata]
MAAFRKIFHAIDEDNTGVITSADLVNYMQKMKYREDFVTTWTRLFDSEHSGFITYEKYCQVLGLNPAEKPSTKTGSSIQQPETETKVEPVLAEPIEEKQEEQQSSFSGHADSRRRRNTSSFGEEEANLEDPMIQKGPRKRSTKSFNTSESNQSKEDTRKSQSRKRKHAASPPKDEPSASVATKPDSEAVASCLAQEEPGDSGMKEFDMPVEAEAQPGEFGEMDTVALQKAEQITTEEPGLKSLNAEDEKSESKIKSDDDEKIRIRDEPEKSDMSSPKQASESAEVHEDVGSDVFDLLISAKEQPTGAIFIEEEDSSKIETGTVTPKSTDDVANPDTPLKVEAESSDKFRTKGSNKKQKRKTSAKMKKDQSAEQPEDSGMDVAEPPIEIKTRPDEAAEYFGEESLEKIASETANLTLAEEPTFPPDSTMEANMSSTENPEMKFMASEEMEKESLGVKSTEPIQREGQESLEADSFEDNYHSPEIVEKDDRKSTSVADSDKPELSKTITESPSKKAEKRKKPKSSAKAKTGESDTKRDRNTPESGKTGEQYSESTAPSEELVQETFGTPEEQGEKLEKQISEPSEAGENKDHSPVVVSLEEFVEVEAPGKEEHKKQSKPHQEGRKKGKKISQSSSHSSKESGGHREKRASESSKKDVDMESSAPAVVLDSATELQNPSESSDAHQEQKHTSPDSENKWQEMPPDSKSSHSSPGLQQDLEHPDVEMTPSHEAVAPTVEESENIEQLQLKERPQMHIVPTPMEVEIAPVAAEPQDFAKTSDTPLDEANITIPEQKASKKKSPDSDKKKSRRAPVGDAKPTKPGSDTEKNVEEHERKSPSPTKHKELPNDGKKTTDKKRKSKKQSKSPSGDKDTISPVEGDIIFSATSIQESAVPPNEFDVESTNFETPFPSMEPTKPSKSGSGEKSGEELVESSPPEADDVVASGNVFGLESAVPIVEPELEQSGDSKLYHEKEPTESAQTEEMGMKPLSSEEASASILETSATQPEQQESTESPVPQKSFESSTEKADISDTPKSPVEPKGDKKSKQSKKLKSAKKDDAKILELREKPGESFPSEADVVVASGEVSGLESAVPIAGLELEQTEDSRLYHEKEPMESAQTEEMGMKPLSSEEASASILESTVTQLEQQESIESPMTQELPESSVKEADVEKVDKPKPPVEAKGDKNKRPKKKTKKGDVKESESTSQKPIKASVTSEPSTIQESDSLVSETQKDIPETSPDTVEDQPKQAPPQGEDFAMQSNKKRAGRKGNTKQKPTKPAEKSSKKIEPAPIIESQDAGEESFDQPPEEIGPSEKNDNNDSKKPIQKKRKAASRQGGGLDKRIKKDEKKQKSEKEKKPKRRKRPQSTEKEGETAVKKSTKRPRIGNLECGRFPKAFPVQVPHKVNQHRRDGAPVSTHALGKAPKGFTTKMSIERRNRDKPSKAIQRWRLRKSLQKVGTIVILLAGRHKGKRAVVIGRHKFSGLLLVTGPFKLNGVPIRRVHPDYVIATKTIIKMDKIPLPGRMQTRQYFARQRPGNKSKTTEENLFVDPSANKKAYVLKEERKNDQKLIDKRVLAAIKRDKNAKMLFAYLRSLFSLSRTDKPHKMVF